MATVGILVRMKARVASTPTSAAARNADSVMPMFSSETQPMEKTWEVTISGLISDDVNNVCNQDQPTLIIGFATKDWELSHKMVKVEATELETNI